MLKWQQTSQVRLLLQWQQPEFPLWACPPVSHHPSSLGSWGSITCIPPPSHQQRGRWRAEGNRHSGHSSVTCTQMSSWLWVHTTATEWAGEGNWSSSSSQSPIPFPKPHPLGQLGGGAQPKQRSCHRVRDQGQALCLGAHSEVTSCLAWAFRGSKVFSIGSWTTRVCLE